MSSSATSPAALTVASASSAKALATTTSTGSGTLTLAAMALAVSTRSASYSDLPTGKPAAARKVLAIPPPTISWSQTWLRLFSTSSLVETLEPATMAAIGLAGLFSALPSASSSAASSGPAQAISANLATPWVEPWARWAVPKASMTKTSHSAAYFCASSSVFFFSPGLKRTFSSNTSSPGFTSTPSR